MPDSCKKKILLGMSGGVDSTTAAALLLQAGFEVVGLTCIFINNEESRRSSEDAATSCAQLGIAHEELDCTREFEETVARPFVDDYASGLTPSPCVSCNARCKIPRLIEAADRLGCELVATGHYARIACLTSNGRYVVKCALDPSKDQSYMLSQLSQDQLARLVLPLGAMTKADVRAQAQDWGLPVADKPDSQDICFIQGGYPEYLVERGLTAQTGNIVDLYGQVLGRHDGLFRYTVGQRKGIGLAASEPYYVIEKRSDTNELVVGFKDHTLIDSLLVEGLVWQAFEKLEEPTECTVKLRYRSQAVACTVKAASPGSPDAVASGIQVDLVRPQPTTAPGQFAVFYIGDTMLGGGMIAQVGHRLWEEAG